MTHATDIVAYTYKAEMLCPSCTLDALNVPASLRAEQSCESILETLAVAQGIDIFNERTFDSGDFPKVVFDSQIEPCGEADCPACGEIDGLCSRERCDSCGEPLV